jgi:spore maturation protein CgeB
MTLLLNAPPLKMGRLPPRNAMQNILLIVHSSLHPALRGELMARGLELRESASWHEIDRSSPERILGAYTWFYKGLREPLRVLAMHRWLQQHNITLFTWNQDAPHYLNYTKLTRAWRLYVAQKLRLFDLYATHTLIDNSRTFASATLYLPNAADTNRYHLHGRTLTNLREPESYRWDVSFFGGMDGNRYKEDRARQKFFSALAKRLNAAGISHRFVDTKDGGMPLDSQIDLIQSSRINLNFGARCEYQAPVASGLPERCYGIPACGGFLLCDRRTHAIDDFTPGENWAEFDGLDDCVTKIEYWLNHFDAARDLAERCHHHVMAHHTYAHRAEKLHKALLAWHEGSRGLLR